MSTGIPYVDETINPWVGCTKIRAGCLNCYAERCAYRLAAMRQENYKRVLDGRKWNGKIGYQMEQLQKLNNWHKPRRILVGSMTDIFHEKVPFCEIVRVFDAMYENTQHTFLITTKRPDRALELARYHKLIHWPDHIWMGISCSTQRDLDEMGPILFDIPASHYWLSAEPLLENLNVEIWVSPFRVVDHGQGAVELDDLPIFEHVVIGCESGPQRRPCNIEWVRSIVQQCKEADVAVYVKQLDLGGKVATDPKDFPEDLRIREIRHD